VLRNRKAVGAAALSMVALALGLAGCSSGASPSATVSKYLAAWSRADYGAMASLVSHPPKDFFAVNRQVESVLGREDVTFRASAITTNGSDATVPITGRFSLTGAGPLVVHSLLSLSNASGSWLVQWSPREILAPLGPRDSVAATVTWPTRAAILGAGGAPLTTQAPMVSVGLEGSRITDAAALAAPLEAAGATAQQVSTAVATAQAHPTWFVPVMSLTQAAYELVKPTIYPIAGTVFENFGTRSAITPGLAAHVVGTVGPITKQELTSLGSPYQVGDSVGQTGIEQAYEQQLAGKPALKIQVVDHAGAPVATVATFKGQPGAPVQTTINPTVQQAAEGALSGVTLPAALVAIDASTGDVLAAVGLPNSDAFDNALAGAYPPGSTFKVVTSADLIEQGGLTPASPASCPPTITVDGEVFHNFEGESVSPLNMQQAFAMSCNAAFIGLAANLPYPSFTSVAAQFGIGATYKMGLSAFGGNVPVPASAADRAATAIGQAKVVVSPLAMAVVAATVDSGTLRLPRLVSGAADDTVAAVPVNPTVVTDLQTMMAAVVDSSIGTAAGAGLPAGTRGKTGTAEFGTANPPATDAWFIGYNGNLAFAVLVVGGGIGGAVAAPIATKFLAAAGTVS
jgi:cell division protein FtsI/penicillin-binding protein 2